MNSLVQSGSLYGVEIWSSRREEIEKVQGRIVKAAFGVAKNTPDYLWKLEAGRSLEIEARRATQYLIEILKMEDNRWLKICLQEEIRGEWETFKMGKGTKVSDGRSRGRQGNRGDMEKGKVRNIGKMAGLQYRNKKRTGHSRRLVQGG